MAEQPSEKPTSFVSVEVDARFLLANERTFLAWMRTALTVMAGGLALTQLSEGISARFGLVAILFGAITALTGYIRFLGADKAIRAHRLPTRGSGPAIQVTGIVLFAFTIITIELLK